MKFVFRILLSLSIFSSSGAYTQPADLFGPLVSKEELRSELEQYPDASLVEIPLGEGGEALVFAVAERTSDSIEYYAKKEFSHPSNLQKNVEALRLFSEFEARGLLGEIRVVKILSQTDFELHLQLIEGQSLTSLLENYEESEELKKIWSRYRDSIKTIANHLHRLGYSMEPGEGHQDCHQLLGVKEPSPNEGLLFYLNDEDQNIAFSIEALNIVVESSTGDLYIIDPL